MKMCLISSTISLPHFLVCPESPSISTTFQQSLDQQGPFHPINAERCQIIIKISTEPHEKEANYAFFLKKLFVHFSCFLTQIESKLLTFKSRGLCVRLSRSCKFVSFVCWTLFSFIYLILSCRSNYREEEKRSKWEKKHVSQRRWRDGVTKKKLLAIREIEGREKQKVGGGGHF